jgi:hypothetical protein
MRLARATLEADLLEHVCRSLALPDLGRLELTSRRCCRCVLAQHQARALRGAADEISFANSLVRQGVLDGEALRREWAAGTWVFEGRWTLPLPIDDPSRLLELARRAGTHRTAAPVEWLDGIYPHDRPRLRATYLFRAAAEIARVLESPRDAHAAGRANAAMHIVTLYYQDAVDALYAYLPSVLRGRQLTACVRRDLATALRLADPLRRRGGRSTLADLLVGL